MTILQSVILGIIQGIGEFLPVSSSAHLILIPFLFNFDLNLTESEKMAFDVALHFGTLISVIAIFWKDWLKLFKGAFDKITKKKDSFENKMFWYLVIATIPGGIIGMAFEDIIENVVRSNILIIALSLAVMGLFLYFADIWASNHYKKENSYEEINFKQAVLIGISQSFAIIPGFSRSGTTILVGRLLGVSREGVSKFTFLLSTPIIFGAFVVNIGNVIITKEVIIGIIVSAIVGILCIKFLLNYIKNHNFGIFAFYRILLSIVIITKLIFF